MKKKFAKTFIALIMCIFMVIVMSSNVFAEYITITTGSNYETGYSYHREYTDKNSVSGYSEGNCVHNTSDNIYVYAYVKSNSYAGNTYVKYLNVATRNAGDIRHSYTNQTKTTSGVIEWNQTVDFTSRSVDGFIYISESAWSPVDTTDNWNGDYTYYWDGDSQALYHGEYCSTH